MLTWETQNWVLTSVNCLTHCSPQLLGYWLYSLWTQMLPHFFSWIHQNREDPVLPKHRRLRPSGIPRCTPACSICPFVSYGPLVGSVSHLLMLQDLSETPRHSNSTRWLLIRQLNWASQECEICPGTAEKGSQTGNAEMIWHGQLQYTIDGTSSVESKEE